MRTGFWALRARSAACSPMTEGNSSLPPNPPPVSAWTTRAALSSEAEAALERRVQVVRALERARDGDAATVGRDRDHRVVLDVELLLVADAVLALEDEVGAGERGLDVVPASIVYCAKMWSDSSGSKTPGSFVVRGLRAVAGLAQGRLVGRGEERQRLGVVLDLAADRHEDRLVGLDRADDVLARDVGGGDDDDLRPVEGGIEVEGIERGVRVGRADRGAVPRPGDDDVVGVQGRAGQLGRSLAPQRRGRAGAAGHDGAGRDDEGVRGLGAGRHASALGPSMAHDDTTGRGGSTGPRHSPPNRPGPVRRGAVRTVIATSGTIRWSHPSPCRLSSAASSAPFALIGVARTMEVTQDILLPVLVAAVIANTVVLLLIVVAMRNRRQRVRPFSHALGAAGQHAVDLVRRPHRRIPVPCRRAADRTRGVDASRGRGRRRRGSRPRESAPRTPFPTARPPRMPANCHRARHVALRDAPRSDANAGVDALTGLIGPAAFTRLVVAEDAGSGATTGRRRSSSSSSVASTG